jgi:hypothetical protein
MAYKTPKRLKKINIMGTEIKIIIDDVRLAVQGAMGLYSNGTIVLASEYGGTADFVDTFTHECFHALQYIIGTQLDPHLEEVIANTTGQMNVHIVNALLKHGTFIPPEVEEEVAEATEETE